jgi:Tol biopolymer transport system component
MQSSRLVIAVVLLSAWTGARASDDGYVLFLSSYLSGDYYVAPLNDIDVAEPAPIQPRKLRLPRRFRDRVQLGNHDVSPDGRTIVFAALSRIDPDWDLYTGRIDLKSARIRDVAPLIQNSFEGAPSRDEDPRFSWDGSQIVYKCDFDICVHGPQTGLIERVAESPCELWGPSFDPTGYSISYTRRGEPSGGSCNADPELDRIWLKDLTSGQTTGLPPATPDGGPDRFAHYLGDGRVIYSHIDGATRGASLYAIENGSIYLFHDQTRSDDDAYPDRHDPNHIAFIGWENGGYRLFVYRQEQADAVRLTSGFPILAPVLFRPR